MLPGLEYVVPHDVDYAAWVVARYTQVDPVGNIKEAWEVFKLAWLTYILAIALTIVSGRECVTRG